MDPEHKIFVNFATPRELRIIPGVGDKMVEAIVEMRLRNSNATASLLSSILRKRLPDDLLACLDFRPNPNFAATDEQQDDGYGAVSLDYEDGYKAQLTEEIKREIENRLWPESSTIPKERGTVGGPEASSVPLNMRGAVRGPEAFFVPWTKPVYKMTTAMQEDPIHQDTVFPKQKTKKHKDDKSQSPKVRRKLTLENVVISLRLQKKSTDQQNWRQNINLQNRRFQLRTIRENTQTSWSFQKKVTSFLIKTGTHFQKRRKNKRNQLFVQRNIDMKHHLRHHLKTPSQILMWSRRKVKRNQSFILCRNSYSMMVKAIGNILNTNSRNMQNHQIGQLRNV